jgi:MFS family permease
MMTTSTDTTRQPDKLLGRQFVTLALAAACFFLGTGAMNVLLPQYVVDELGGSEVAAGVAMGSMAVSALFTRMWFGRLADRRGARLIVVIGALLFMVASLLLVVSENLGMVILSRLVFGGGMGAFVTGSTMLSIELAPDHRRSQAASYILISFHLGLGLGPLIGESLADVLSYDAIWLMNAVIALAAAAIASLLEKRPHLDHGEPAPLIHRNAIAPGLVTMFGIVAFNGVLQFTPLYGREIGLHDVGLVYTTASITLVVVRLAFGWVPDVIGPIRAGAGALWLTVVACLVIALWAEPAGLFIGAALLAIGLSLQSPSFIAVAVEGVAARERGSAMATYTAFFDVANAFVGPMFGFIVTGASYRAAFLTAGAMSLVALVVLYLVVQPQWTRARSLSTAPAVI